MTLKELAPLIAILSFFSLTIIQGTIETINNWKLRNYYNRAVLQYEDVNKNGKIEEE